MERFSQGLPTALEPSPNDLLTPELMVEGMLDDFSRRHAAATYRDVQAQEEGSALSPSPSPLLQRVF